MGGSQQDRQVLEILRTATFSSKARFKFRKMLASLEKSDFEVGETWKKFANVLVTPLIAHQLHLLKNQAFSAPV